MNTRDLAQVPPSYQVGQKLLTERKFDEALKEFRRVVAVEPGNANANFQVGRLLLEANRADQAIWSFSRSVMAMPNQPKRL